MALDASSSRNATGPGCTVSRSKGAGHAGRARPASSIGLERSMYETDLWAGLEQFHLAGERAREIQIVGVEPSDVAASCASQTGIAVGRNPLRGAVSEHAQPRIGEPGQQLGRLVRGGVVMHEQLDPSRFWASTLSTARPRKDAWLRVGMQTLTRASRRPPCGRSCSARSRCRPDSAAQADRRCGQPAARRSARRYRAFERPGRPPGSSRASRRASSRSRRSRHSRHRKAIDRQAEGERIQGPGVGAVEEHVVEHRLLVLAEHRMRLQL